MGMVDARNDEKLQRLLDRIVPALEPEAVYLFGSRARGDFHEDSDYDLLVIVPDDAPKERRVRTFRQVRDRHPGGYRAVPAFFFRSEQGSGRHAELQGHP